jgi:hypothetical protein
VNKFDRLFTRAINHPYAPLIVIAAALIILTVLGD